MSQSKLMCLVAIIAVVVIGCSNEQPSGNQVAETTPVQSANKVGTKVYIDSVPAGATVSLLPRDDDDKTTKERRLGKTPLVIDASECPTMRFLVMMQMDEYIQKAEKIPQMKSWVAKFKSEQYFGDSSLSQHYFNFDTAQSRLFKSMNGGIVAIGPVYELEWPNHNRLCAIFIPRGVKQDAAYSFMPPRGTFPELRGNWPNLLRTEYHLSEDQAKEALEYLTRCGKYIVTVKDPFQEGVGRRYSITIQASPNEMIVTTVQELRLIPGYND